MNEAEQLAVTLLSFAVGALRRFGVPRERVLALAADTVELVFGLTDEDVEAARVLQHETAERAEARLRESVRS